MPRLQHLPGAATAGLSGDRLLRPVALTSLLVRRSQKRRRTAVLFPVSKVASGRPDLAPTWTGPRAVGALVLSAHGAALPVGSTWSWCEVGLTQLLPTWRSDEPARVLERLSWTVICAALMPRPSLAALGSVRRAASLWPDPVPLLPRDTQQQPSRPLPASPAAHGPPHALLCGRHLAGPHPPQLLGVLMETELMLVGSGFDNLSTASSQLCVWACLCGSSLLVRKLCDSLHGGPPSSVRSSPGVSCLFTCCKHVRRVGRCVCEGFCAESY